MSRTDEETIAAATRFAARFGFLTMDLFFDYICPGSRAHKYRKWGLLINQHWFYPSKLDARTVFLSAKAKRIFSLQDVHTRSPLFVEHDSLVASVLLALEATGNVTRSWTESELRRRPWDAFSIVGSDRVEKLPDLVLDLKTKSDNLRVAIEVEVSRKSRARYAHIALTYLEMRKIDLVVFGCSRELIAGEILKAFSGEAFAHDQKHPAIFLLPSFERDKLAASTGYCDNNYTLGKFLEAATQVPYLTSAPGDDSEISVSEYKTEAAS